MSKKMVQFLSEGMRCEADLYLPAGFDESGRYPAVVLGHGFTVARTSLVEEGRMFAEAGFVALKSGQTLKGKGFQLIPPGDRLVVMTPGGAGIGKPVERDRVQVGNDLADGLISQETAETVYAYKPPRAAE